VRTRDDQKEITVREQALKMIVREGFDGFSMQKLARVAGVSPATLYIYFKNREDLLNQLFDDVQQTFADEALKDFDPEAPFAEGLWRQWRNRLRFILDHPEAYRFMEQFRHSPLIDQSGLQLAEFRENMKVFVTNAITRGDIPRMEPATFWSMAYGPFYALVKFHLQGKTMMDTDFKLTEARMKTTFLMVLRAFNLPDKL